MLLNWCSAPERPAHCWGCSEDPSESTCSPGCRGVCPESPLPPVLVAVTPCPGNPIQECSGHQRAPEPGEPSAAGCPLRADQAPSSARGPAEPFTPEPPSAPTRLQWDCVKQAWLVRSAPLGMGFVPKSLPCCCFSITLRTESRAAGKGILRQALSPCEQAPGVHSFSHRLNMLRIRRVCILPL